MKIKLLHLIIILFSILPGKEIMAQDPMITIWNTTHSSAANNSIRLNIQSSEYDVYWENVENPTINGNQLGLNAPYTLSFPTAGIYKVSIYSSAPDFHFRAGENAIQSKNLIEVTQWGDVQYSSFYKSFESCINLNITATDTPNLSSVTTMRDAFNGCVLIDSIPNLNDWNISNVHSLYRTFYNLPNFHQDLDKWNTSNIDTLQETFYNNTVFNGNITTWDVSNVKTMHGLFWNCYNFNQNINTWDVSNVTHLSRIFQNNYLFNQPLDQWNVSNVVTLQYAFNNARLFNQPLNSWNVGNVKDLGATFQGAKVFNQNLNYWNVSNVTTMWTTFWDAHAFNGDITNWQLDNLENLNSTFLRAYNFNRDLSNWNTSNVTNFQSTFYAAYSFDQDISTWDVSNGTTFAYMFKFAETFNRDISSWNVSNGQSFGEMFYYADAFNQNLSNWNLQNATNLNLFLSYSGMSCENYEHSLRGWVLNPNTKTGFSNVGVHNIKYDTTAIALRDSVSEILNWTLNSDIQETGCRGLPLSIENILFQGHITNNGIILNGSIVEYFENNSFIELQIQKSFDGINFFPLTENLESNEIEYLDTDIMNNPTVYYKLKAQIGDNTYYSTTLTFQNNISDNHYTLSPNPASESITIRSNNPEHFWDYTIYNTMGVIIKSGKNHSSNYPILIENLPTGNYWILINGGNEITKLQFAKIQ